MAPQCAGQAGVSTASGRSTGSPDSEVWRTIFASSRRTRQEVSLLLRVPWLCKKSETCESRRSCGRPRAFSSLNTGNRLHVVASFVTYQSCQQVHASMLAQSRGTTAPQKGSCRGTSSQTGRLRAVGFCGGLAGLWWWSTKWVTSSRPLTAPCRVTCSPSRLRAVPRTTLLWQGRSLWTRSHIATISGSKGKALGANGKRAHVSGRLLCCHDEVMPVKVEGQATEADVDRYDEDRWEVQMLGAEVEARNEGKTSQAPDDDETALLENDSEGNEAHSNTMREMAQ